MDQVTGMSKQLWQICERRPLLTTAFATLGGLWTSYQLYRLACFSHVHFVHRSSLARYKGDSGSSWALITGASDGIGKAFAEELCQRGFNVVIHGRNEKKLLAVKEELSQGWTEREIRILVHDATDCAPGKFQHTAEAMKDVNLRILINNVAGDVRPRWVPLKDTDQDRTRQMLEATARFSTEITRILLPRLIAHAPSLIMNIGSFVSELPAPYYSVGGASKAYIKAWSRSLNAEMKVEGHDIEVMCIMVGGVATPNEPRRSGFFVATAKQMAVAALGKVGCGLDVVFGYWPHEIHYQLMVNLLPGPIKERLLMGIVKKMKTEEETALKQD